MTQRDNNMVEQTAVGAIWEFVGVYSLEKLRRIEENHLEDYCNGKTNARLVANDEGIPVVVAENILQKLKAVHAGVDQ